MNPRRAGYAMVAIGLGLIVWFAAPPSGAAGRFSFPHNVHLRAQTIAAAHGPVDATWAGADPPDKDCRGCHDFLVGDRQIHLDREKTCDRCHDPLLQASDKHTGDKHLELKLQGNYAPPGFPHKQHLYTKDGSARHDVTCFSCHAMQVDREWIEFAFPAPGLGPMGRDGKGGGKYGEKTCTDCHVKHDPKSEGVPQFRLTGDGDQCVKCHKAPEPIEPLRYKLGKRVAAGARPFEHADHGGSAGDCVGCHATMPSSNDIWDSDPGRDTAGKCETCHIEQGTKNPLVTAGPAKADIVKIDFSNFPHAKHYGKKELESCKACHYPEEIATSRAKFPERKASPEPVGREQLLHFAACDACHGTRDGIVPAKPGSWHVDGHGTGDKDHAWACFKCHQGGVEKGADGKDRLAIAQVSVSNRQTIGLSKFTEHSHPGMTSAGRAARPLSPAGSIETAEGVAKACIDCHLGDKEKLTSRLTGKAFTHAAHLPVEPKMNDCLPCHTTSAVARRSENLTRFDAHLAGAPAPTGAAAAAKGCLECHVGASAADLKLDLQPERKVPQFDHGGHVRAASLVAGGKGMSCMECHVKDDNAPSGYTTAAEVMNCTKCHSHTDPEKKKRTGPDVSAGDSTKCFFCHTTVLGYENGAVKSPPAGTIQRGSLVLAADPGRQHHDKGGDCNACHVRDAAPAAVPYQERVAKAHTSLSIHEDTAFKDGWWNDPEIQKPEAKGHRCDECHMTPPRAYLRGRR